jgi:tRNA (cmo5U34)-methyltransferase
MNYTLQFIPQAERTTLMEKIYQGLLPGGALIIAEKVLDSDARQETLFQSLHADFKRAQGYSDIEISQKRASLENVLISETLATHRARLESAGFREIAVWFHCYNFAALLAVK